MLIGPDSHGTTQHRRRDYWHCNNRNNTRLAAGWLNYKRNAKTINIESNDWRTEGHSKQGNDWTTKRFAWKSSTSMLGLSKYEVHSVPIDTPEREWRAVLKVFVLAQSRDTQYAHPRRFICMFSTSDSHWMWLLSWELQRTHPEFNVIELLGTKTQLSCKLDDLENFISDTGTSANQPFNLAEVTDITAWPRRDAICPILGQGVRVC